MGPTSPDAFNQQSQGPANLPPMPAQPAPGGTPVPAAAGPIAPAPTGTAPMDVALQAEQLTVRYANNPHQLAENFGQLKSGYLLHYYHITNNPAGN